MDTIDITISRVYEVDPTLLADRTHNRKVTDARTAAICYRHETGKTIPELARMYRRTNYGIQKLLDRGNNLLQYDKNYAARFRQAMVLLLADKPPYTSDLLRVGATVWSRPDSHGTILQGTVTHIQSGRFWVQQPFIDPSYCSNHRVEDGRVSAKYETSWDIVSIRG